MYTILKDFQSLIGAIFALATLVIGAHLKFSYDRRAARILREERQAALYGSLYIETLLLSALIAQLGDALLDHAHADADISEDFVAMHGLPDPTVYNAIVKDLGEMDIYIAASFVSFYSHYSTLLRDISLLTQNLPDRDARHVLRIVQHSIAKAGEALAMVDGKLNREDAELPSMKAIADFLNPESQEAFAPALATDGAAMAGGEPPVGHSTPAPGEHTIRP